MPEHRIIDTNVPLTAAGMNENATTTCKQTCVNLVNLVRNRAVCIVIDRDGEVLREYANKVRLQRNLSLDLAGLFLIYIRSNAGYRDRVRQILLRKDNGEYVDWPQDKKLADFDRNDRKWVALARAFTREEDRSAPIAYAIERDWDKHRNTLTSHGVELEPLCATDHHAGRAAL